MAIFDLPAFDVNRDEPNIRVVDLDGNKIRFERTDPYGFWEVSLERGQLPEHLRQQWTDYDFAYRDVIRYYTDKNRLPKAKPTKKA